MLSLVDLPVSDIPCKERPYHHQNQSQQNEGSQNYRFCKPSGSDPVGYCDVKLAAMLDLWDRLSVTIYKLFASVIGYIIYHINGLLVALAHAFRSRTLDDFSTRYSRWYNGYLLTSILQRGGVKAKVIEQFRS